MIDYIITKLVDSGVSIAKDILSKRIKETNEQLLEKKIKAARKRQLSSSEIKKITLDEKEEIHYQIWIDKDEGYESLSTHVSFVREWSSHIGFNDLQGKKSVKDIYVELDTYLTPLRRHFDIIERDQKKPLKKANTNVSGLES